jgi:hypothetical protein
MDNHLYVLTQNYEFYVIVSKVKNTIVKKPHIAVFTDATQIITLERKMCSTGNKEMSQSCTNYVNSVPITGLPSITL